MVDAPAGVDMRVMQLVDSLAYGGKERVLVDVANALSDRGHAVSVCVTRTNTAMARHLRPQIPVAALNRTWTLDPLGPIRFRELLRVQRPEIIHVHGISAFFFPALARALGIVSAPLLLHDHTGQIEINTSIPKWFRLWGRRMLSQYVGVYERLGEWAASAGVPVERIDVIGNAIDLSVYKHQDSHQVLRPPKGGSVLRGVIIGRIHPDKGLDVLIEAVAKCRSRLEIVHVGGDEDRPYARNCRSRISDLRLTDRFSLMGVRDDVPQILQDADFGIIASRSESGPLALIEMMASGLPFVSTLVGDVGHRVNRLGLPVFVPSDDVAAFTCALDNMATISTEERKARGARGREIAFEQFDVTAAASRWEQVYARVVAVGESR